MRQTRPMALTLKEFLRPEALGLGQSQTTGGASAQTPPDGPDSHDLQRYGYAAPDRADLHPQPGEEVGAALRLLSAQNAGIPF